MVRHDRQPSAGSRRGRRGLTLLAVTAAVLVVGAVLAYSDFHAAAPALPGTPLADQGHRHLVTDADPHEPYNSDPPTSGAHLPYIAPWGIHSRPIPRELQVHNLEDGGVLVQYGCDCPDVVQKLRVIVEKYDKQVILAPYPGMQSRIALTAWSRIERLDDVDPKRIVAFIEAYRGIDHHQ